MFTSRDLKIYHRGGVGEELKVILGERVRLFKNCFYSKHVHASALIQIINARTYINRAYELASSKQSL